MLFGRTFERRVISHQPVSLIWSFSLCQFFPPLQMYLDFRCPKEYCRLLFIPQCNVLDQKPTDRTMASVCVCVCICEGIVKDQIVSGNEYSSFFIIFTCVCVSLSMAFGFLLLDHMVKCFQLSIPLMQVESLSFSTFASTTKIMKYELKKTYNTLTFSQKHTRTHTHHI